MIRDLEKRGFTEVAICGGSEIYTMFMQAGVVDYVYLTVEPIIFGAGITLFNKEVEAKLVLESSTKTAGGTLFNDYKVITQGVHENWGTRKQ